MTNAFHRDECEQNDKLLTAVARLVESPSWLHKSRLLHAFTLATGLLECEDPVQTFVKRSCEKSQVAGMAGVAVLLEVRRDMLIMFRVCYAC